MVARLLACCLLINRFSAAHLSSKHDQAPNDAFVNKLKELASQLPKGSNGGGSPTVASTSNAGAASPSNADGVRTAASTSTTPAAAAVPPTPEVQTPPTPPAASQPALDQSAPPGNSGFMKSLDALKSMLGSHNTAAAATPVVVAAASASSSSETQSGIEQQLNALKGFLHPSPPSNVVMVSPEPPTPVTEPAPQPPTPVASVTVPVVAPATAIPSNGKEEEDDEEEGDDVDTVVNKMVDSTHNAKNAALKTMKPKAPKVSGGVTNAQRVAKMASQYIEHVPKNHMMLNKKHHHPEPIRP